MTPVRVEREHLPAIAALEKEVFAHPWSEEALELLCTDTAIGFVLMDGARAAAYGGMMCVAGECYYGWVLVGRAQAYMQSIPWLQMKYFYAVIPVSATFMTMYAIRDVIQAIRLPWNK